MTPITFAGTSPVIAAIRANCSAKHERAAVQFDSLLAKVQANEKGSLTLLLKRLFGHKEINFLELVATEAETELKLLSQKEVCYAFQSLFQAAVTEGANTTGEWPSDGQIDGWLKERLVNIRNLPPTSHPLPSNQASASSRTLRGRCNLASTSRCSSLHLLSLSADVHVLTPPIALEGTPSA